MHYARSLGLTLISCLSLALVTACGSKSTTETPAAAAATTLLYADVSANINSNCATSSCHASGSSYGDYSSLATIKAKSTNPSKMTTRIKATDGTHMPQNDTAKTYAASADGVKLLEWLAGGADLK